MEMTRTRTIGIAATLLAAITLGSLSVTLSASAGQWGYHGYGSHERFGGPGFGYRGDFRGYGRSDHWGRFPGYDRGYHSYGSRGGYQSPRYGWFDHRGFGPGFGQRGFRYGWR